MTDMEVDRYGPRSSRVLIESFYNLILLGRRSVLALIGIAVGCASIVALINVGESAAGEAMKIFRGMGADIISLNIRSQAGVAGPNLESIKTDHMKKTSPRILTLAPVMLGSSMMYSEGEEMDITIVGASPALHKVMNQKIVAGRMITIYDAQSMYAVIGSEVAERLSVQISQLIQVEGYFFTVVGIAARQLDNPLIPFSANDAVFLPADIISRVGVKPEISAYVARISNAENALDDAELLRKYLRLKLPDIQVDILVPQQLLEGMERQSRTFSYLLTALGAISLLVGGIGVMNVMVMSVSERRKEIGIRMALGARTMDIRNLFICEAAALSVTGAGIGAIVGILVAYFFTVISGWEFELSPLAIPLGVLSSLGVGILFGIQPALSASRMTPAQALRDD